MTQEELDEILNTPVDTISDLDSDVPDFKDLESLGYKSMATREWPPPPPNKKHQVVHQLDDVTRDTEVKAVEVFDQLDVIDLQSRQIVKLSKEIAKSLKEQEELFQKLSDHFPNIKSFKAALERAKSSNTLLANIKESADACSDAVLQSMDIMQFQDINRQRIERVINVMRTLAQYMNSLFDSKIDDSSRTTTATFISGDHGEVATAEEIEELIASFGKSN